MVAKFYKRPSPSLELQALHYLNPRTKLSTSDLRTYEILQKGYLGERKFYHLLKELLSSDCIVLFDLLLTSNGTTFQIDCILIFQETIYLIEIKNFEGDFYRKGENWFSVSTRNEIRNPLLQLNRSEFLLRHFLQSYKYNLPVKPYVVFVNNAFTLYEAPMQLSILLPTQQCCIIININSTRSILATQHERLANHFIKHHIKGTPFGRLPEYNIKDLRTGVTCHRCRHFMVPFSYRKMRCQNCGDTEGVPSAIMRSVVEVGLVFAERKIKVTLIYEWCGGIFSRSTIRSILYRHMNLVHKSQLSYYEFRWD